MEFTFAHNNFNVLDLEKSLKFYKEALGLEVVREKKTPAFTLAYLGDKKTPHQLELTWLKDRKKPYDLGENEFHLAFAVQDFDAAHALHQKMGCRQAHGRDRLWESAQAAGPQCWTVAGQNRPPAPAPARPHPA